MATRIFIPTPLRSYAGNLSQIEVDAPDVHDALKKLVSAHPGLRPHLFDDTGTLRSFVGIYLNDEDIRYLSPARSILAEKDVISIIPAIAGGTGK